MRHDRLRQIREKRNVTQAELAERVEISAKQMMRYEAGSSEPAADVLAKMAVALGVSADYLLGITDETGDRYSEKELNNVERKLLSELREGRVTDALETLAVLTKKN